jgi:DNA polymerase (family 10)
MALREAAVRRGLHVSEYGVLDDSTGETRRCEREEEVYALLGLEYIEPELRENRGELEAAANGTLPSLITVDDLRGDLHCHTTASDGTASIEEMALAARGAGYEYLAITDHSTSVAVHIDAAQLSSHVARIRELSGTDAVGGLTLLAGSEVNILPDGSLDYDDETLAQLDWVVASVHSSFAMDSAAMTERMVRAMSNPLVDMIGHLSGRKIERRPPYHFDFPAIVEAARDTGTLLEINSSPDRRDMNDVHARAAAEAGIPIAINCDAHRVGGFEVARYGVATARRAWLGPDAVVNTRPWDEVAAVRPRARARAA